MKWPNADPVHHRGATLLKKTLRFWIDGMSGSCAARPNDRDVNGLRPPAWI